MKRLLRKTLLIVVLFAPLFTNTDCKKQKKCGCGKDVLNEFSGPGHVFFTDENPTIAMQPVGNYIDTYSFCNPDEVRQKSEFANIKYGEEVMVFGHVYWDCNFVMQSSNSYQYGSYYRAYNIYVTDIYMDMYGKDNSNTDVK
jgi:hypothetical protein